MATSRAVIFDIGGVLLRLGTQEYLDEMRKVLGREGGRRHHDRDVA